MLATVKPWLPAPAPCQPGRTWPLSATGSLFFSDDTGSSHAGRENTLTNLLEINAALPLSVQKQMCGAIPVMRTLMTVGRLVSPDLGKYFCRCWFNSQPCVGKGGNPAALAEQKTLQVSLTSYQITHWSICICWPSKRCTEPWSTLYSFICV